MLNESKIQVSYKFLQIMNYLDLKKLLCRDIE